MHTGILGGPPCNSWSRALVRGEAGGPEAVRDLEHLWGKVELHGAEADKVLAANLHCATFIRSKLHLNSKLRHHTAVLLPGC